jgi:hypothetical protein
MLLQHMHSSIVLFDFSFYYFVHDILIAEPKMADKSMIMMVKLCIEKAMESMSSRCFNT